MTELRTRKPAVILSPASQPDLKAARRLIVIIPPGEGDFSTLAGRLWELARAAEAHVQLCGLFDDPAQELGLRRSLATASAMLNAAGLAAQVDVVPGRSWLETVKSRLLPGDMLVYWNEPQAGSLRGPLGQILRAQLDAPVYIMSGPQPEPGERVRWPARAAVWIGSAVIILGSILLQVRIAQSAGSLVVPLQLLSIPVTIWLILAWNSLWG